MIISDKNSPNEPNENSKLWRELKKATEIKEHYLSWVAAEIELNEGNDVNSASFSIRDGANNRNRNTKLNVQKTTLQSDIDYEFVFVLMNEFDDIRRFDYRKMRYDTVTGARVPKNINLKNSAEESGPNLALLSLLLLLLVPICIWFAVR